MGIQRTEIFFQNSLKPVPGNLGQGEKGQECQETGGSQELLSLTSALPPGAFSVSFQLKTFAVQFKYEISLSSKLEAVTTAFLQITTSIPDDTSIMFPPTQPALVRTGHLLHPAFEGLWEQSTPKEN